MTWIKAHFQRYRKREPWNFCWRIAIEGTIVSLALSIVLGFLEGGDRDIGLNMGFPVFVFVIVVVFPVIETRNRSRIGQERWSFFLC